MLVQWLTKWMVIVWWFQWRRKRDVHRRSQLFCSARDLHVQGHPHLYEPARKHITYIITITLKRSKHWWCAGSKMFESKPDPQTLDSAGSVHTRLFYSKSSSVNSGCMTCNREYKCSLCWLQFDKMLTAYFWMMVQFGVLCNRITDDALDWKLFIMQQILQLCCQQLDEMFAGQCHEIIWIHNLTGIRLYRAVCLFTFQRWSRYQIILLGDRGTCVNNLPKVVTQQCPGAELCAPEWPQDYKSGTLPLRLPSHTFFCWL